MAHFVPVSMPVDLMKFAEGTDDGASLSRSLSDMRTGALNKDLFKKFQAASDITRSLPPPLRPPPRKVNWYKAGEPNSSPSSVATAPDCLCLDQTAEQAFAKSPPISDNPFLRTDRSKSEQSSLSSPTTAKPTMSAENARTGPVTKVTTKASLSLPPPVLSMSCENNPACKESYLLDEDFQKLFHMTKREFYELRTWKQRELKNSVGLF